MQVAFSWQSHSPVSMSQSGPLHPTSHSQVKPVAPSVHVPCTQGSQDPLPQLTPSQASPPAPAVPSMVPPEPPEVPPLPPPLPPLPPPLPPVPPAPSSSSGIEHRSPPRPPPPPARHPPPAHRLRPGSSPARPPPPRPPLVTSARERIGSRRRLRHAAAVDAGVLRAGAQRKQVRTPPTTVREDGQQQGCTRPRQQALWHNS